MTLDFVLARSKHLAWKLKVESFLHGDRSLTEAQAVSHRDCELGEWLYSTGLKKYEHISQMRDLELAHIELHAIVRRIVQMKRAGDEARARLELKKLGPASNTLIRLLKEVEEDYSASRGPEESGVVEHRRRASD